MNEWLEAIKIISEEGDKMKGHMMACTSPSKGQTCKGCSHKDRHKWNSDCMIRCGGLGCQCMPIDLETHMTKKENMKKSKMRCSSAVGKEAAPGQVKLRIRLEKWEKALMLQVLEMDERFRRAGGAEIKEHTAPNGLKIVSDQWPYMILHANHLYSIHLRGTCLAEDYKPEATHFETNAGRDATYDAVVAALRDWSANWPGFKDPVSKEETRIDAPGVLEFR
jgi:hypothetical protein